jgi:hypothetical protein
MSDSIGQHKIRFFYDFFGNNSIKSRQNEQQSMKSSKLVDILRGLAPNEMVQCRLFLPYGLSSVVKLDVAVPTILQLFDFLHRFHPDFEAIDLTEEAAFYAAFGQVPFSKTKLSRLQSVLLREIEKFIACQQILTDGFQKNLHLTQFFAQRGLDNRFALALSSLKKELEEDAKLDRHYFQNRLLIEFMVSDYESLRNTKRDGTQMSAGIETLDVFFLVARLEWVLWARSQHQAIALDLEPVLSIVPELDSLIQKLNLNERQPIIQLYRLALEVLNEHTNFDLFCEILANNEAHLSFDQKRMFHAIERNFCVTHYNRGQKAYLSRAFSLLKDHLEKGYLHYQGKNLIPSTLQTIVILGLRCGELPYIKSILEQYQGRLYGTEEAEQIEAFNWANYYFHAGDYKKAFDTLPNHRFKDLYYDLGFRRLEIQILYELKQEDLLDAKLEAFKNYLFQRSKVAENPLPPYYADMYNNFVNLVKRLQNIAPDSVGKLKKNLDLLQTNHPYAERDWLTKKIEARLKL